MTEGPLVETEEGSTHPKGDGLGDISNLALQLRDGGTKPLSTSASLQWNWPLYIMHISQQSSDADLAVGDHVVSRATTYVT